MTCLEPDDDVLEAIGKGATGRRRGAALHRHQALNVPEDFGQQLLRLRIEFVRAFEILVQFGELHAQRFWVHGVTP
jgi:hypothetical protein